MRQAAMFSCQNCTLPLLLLLLLSGHACARPEQLLLPASATEQAQSLPVAGENTSTPSPAAAPELKRPPPADGTVSTTASPAAAAEPQKPQLPVQAAADTGSESAGGPGAEAATQPAIINVPITTSRAAAPELPEYLKNCFYAEEELCLNWHRQDIGSDDAGVGNGAAAESSNNNGQAEPTDALSSNSSNSSSLTPHGNGSQGPPSHPNPQSRDINSCPCRAHPVRANSWYCCNITQITMISSCSNILNWTNLHVRNLSAPLMDLSNSIYRSLQSLAVTDGNISQLINGFPRHSSLKCLNISNNNIEEIESRAIKDVPHLEFFGIAQNNLSRVPHRNQNKNIALDISGNQGLLCEPLNEVIYSDSFNFVNPENSFCLYNATHKWFNSTDYMSIKQLERNKQCGTKCPVIPNFGNCTCKSERIMIVQGDQSKPICHVDCSNLGLVELPAKLPDNTFTLNITNNKIRSLGDHFHTNPTYHNIAKLMADNNQISSIYEFEGTKFLEHFQRIYMRNNSLSKIPEYFLNNALMDTDIGRRIYLGGNRLQCDCNSAKTLQNWLKERSTDIPDYMEIRCRNLPQSVIELQETKLCQSPPDWTDYIYYLIAAEVFLLLALITKVSYDYWVFKTAGYLPWPASKMPKLPCDWLCES